MAGKLLRVVLALVALRVILAGSLAVYAGWGAHGLYWYWTLVAAAVALAAWRSSRA